MHSAPLKLGFIGGALNSAVGVTHKISAQMDGCWHLSAGCFSTDAKTNHLTGEAWGLPEQKVYSNYRELLDNEKENLDAVVVLTPTPSHAEIVIAALNHDIPVICEKALAVSSLEAGQIRQTVEENQGYLTVTYNYTGYAMVRELRQIIQKGLLGKLNQIHIEMPQEGFLRLDKNNDKPHPQEWRLKDYEIPTVSLDLGVHIHHIIHFLSGEKPIEVIAEHNNFGFFQGIVDNVTCHANYTNHLHCQIWYGKTAIGHTNGLRVRVYGSVGSAEWHQMQPETLIIHDNKGGKKILERSCCELEIANEDRYNRFKAGHPTGFIEAFANYYYDAAETLRGFKLEGQFASPWIFGADIAEEGLLMLEAMARSATHRTWQAVK